MKLRPLSSNEWIVIACVVAICGFIAYAAVNWYKIVDDEQWVGVHGEAATNPYLAFERFLVAREVNVQKINRTKGIDDLIAGKGEVSASTIIVGDRRLAQMNPTRVSALAAWVQAGGHLIIEAEQSYLEDPLLYAWGLDRKRLVWRNGKYVERDRMPKDDEEDDFNLTLDPTPKTTPRTGTGGQSDDSKAQDGKDDTTDNTKDDAKKESQEDTATPRDDGKERKIERPSRNQSLPANLRNMMNLVNREPAVIFTSRLDGTKLVFSVVAMPYQNVAIDEKRKTPASMSARVLEKDNLGGRLLQLADGKGRVTVLSNFDAMVGKTLSEADNAEFIWHLVSDGKAEKPSVALALIDQRAGLFSWLTNNAWMVLISALALFAIWLWRVLPRFGPLRPLLGVDRRSLREHLDAAGRFLAKHEEWQELVTPARTRTLQRLQRAHPKLAAMLPHMQSGYLATALGADETEIHRLLFSVPDGRRDVLKILSGLLRLNQRLNQATVTTTTVSAARQ
jgi:hypothetical protein